MDVEPRRRLNLGKISRNATDEIHKTVVLKRGDGGPIKPTVSPARRGRPMHVKTEIREIEPGAHYEMDVTMAPPWPSGRFTDTLSLSTGVAEAPTMTYFITATVPPRLTTRPGYIMMPLNRTEEVTRQARIHWEDNKPAKVTELSSTIPGAKVEIEDDIHGQLVKLTVPPGNDRPKGRQFVTIKIDEGKASEVQVPVVFRNQRLRAAQRRQIAPARHDANVRAQKKIKRSEAAAKDGK
jgi:hypothetical protein